MWKWYHTVPLWLGTWAVLLYVSCASVAVTSLAIGVMAMYITDWISKALQNSLPRHNITDTKDKAVLVTGCDSGFGAKLAVALDQLGFKVYAGCLFPSGEGAVNLESNSKRIQIIKLDVTKQQDVDDAYRFIKKDLSDDERLWSVVNNAGVGAYTDIEFCPLEAYRRLLDVNALGLIRVTKAFLPLLRSASEGRIVIVASLAGRHTFPGFSAYSMSKHAAVSFADALRLEMDKWKITVHTIEPTLYKTPISDERAMQKAMDNYWNDTPDDIRKSYGEDYLQDSKSSVTHHMSRAKPVEKIQEVVDDMIDAVAGTDPKSRYVPSVVTQIRARLLSVMPTDMKDSLFLKTQPQTPPADISARRPPPLLDPRRQGRIKGPGGSFLKRLYSMPITEKTPITPPLSKGQTVQEIRRFQF